MKLHNAVAIAILSTLSLGSAHAAVNGSGAGQSSNELSTTNGVISGNSQNSAGGGAQGGAPQLPQANPEDMGKAAKDQAGQVKDKISDTAKNKAQNTKAKVAESREQISDKAQEKEADVQRKADQVQAQRPADRIMQAVSQAQGSIPVTDVQNQMAQPIGMLGQAASAAQGGSASGQASASAQGGGGQAGGNGQFVMSGSGGQGEMNAKGQAGPANTAFSGQLKFSGQTNLPQMGTQMPSMPQAALPQAPQLPLPRL